jgi:nicotinate dehydrogenase subunit B
MPVRHAYAHPERGAAHGKRWREATVKTAFTISRRSFIFSGGAVVVGFAMSASLPKWALAQQAAAGRTLDVNQVDSFLAFHADGSVTIYTSKVDVGTGLQTAMCQVAAEELGVPVERFSVVEGDTALTPNHGGTGGSTGVPRGAMDVRRAAATARQTILRMGGEQLGRPASELVLAEGMVRPAAGGAGIAISVLIGDKPLSVPLDANAPLRRPADYTVVGKPILRSDMAGKCTGQHLFLQDFSLPGMLHARVIRPPSFGAKLVSVDDTSLRDIPGVSLVRVESFLAVVSSDEWAVVRAARQLRAAWTEWQGLPGSEGLDRTMREGAIDRDEVLVNRGDAVAALPSSAKQLSASYHWPFQSHASLGPSCAVADVKEDGATVWTSSQGTYGLRANLAEIFSIPEEKLCVIYLDGSGSYGTNGANDAAADALLLSQRLGKPVRVQWTREDELGWDPKGPSQLLELRGGLNADGRITSWETQMWIPGTIPGNRPLVGVDAAALGQDSGRGAGQISQNGDPPYATPHLRVVVHWLRDCPLRLSNLRAPGKIANVFAIESFTDELAAEAKVDAVEFRLRGLTDPRAIEVIRRTAEMIGWQSRPSPNPSARQGNFLVGRGIGYAHYKQSENYVAIAMEVAVERTSGAIRVRRVSCAHDCGLIINPDGLRNQVEGCIVQTLSRALHEEVRFDRSKVTSVDWANYPILTFPEAPPVQVALIDRPELPPLGAGEAATAPVAAALANALYDASGVRLRSAPMRAEQIRAGLADS